MARIWGAMGYGCLLLWMAGSAVPCVAAGPHTQVKDYRGRPTFFLDGQPYTRPLFATYHPLEKYYRQMAQAGIEVFNFQTNCAWDVYGHGKPTWPTPDVWDFTQIDKRARAILRARPDAYILPRIYISAPPWWLDRHPDELMVLDHGGTTFREPYVDTVAPKGRRYGSLLSQTWRKAMGQALARTVRHMMDSPWGDRIFGFEISALATEEWYYWTSNQ